MRITGDDFFRYMMMITVVILAYRYFSVIKIADKVEEKMLAAVRRLVISYVILVAGSIWITRTSDNFIFNIITVFCCLFFGTMLTILCEGIVKTFGGKK